MFKIKTILLVFVWNIWEKIKYISIFIYVASLRRIVQIFKELSAHELIFVEIQVIMVNFFGTPNSYNGDQAALLPCVHYSH